MTTKNFNLFLIISLFLLCFFSAPSAGPVGVDKAVDFTVSDLSGNSHNLFSYFNENKYVGLAFCANPIG